MPRQTNAQRSLLGAPTLMTAGVEGPSQLAAGTPVVLKIRQGDDKRWLFKLKKDDGQPFPLTGYTAALQFRTAVADTATGAAIEPTVAVTDAANGEITVTLLSEKSVLLVQPTYLWDLEIIETAASWTTTIAEGTLAVTKEVTRTGLP